MVLLTYKQIENGIEEYAINLKELFPKKEERKLFEQKWKEFYNSDINNKHIFNKKDDKLIYLSESWIPTKKDSRKPALLLFGNPAPHSVINRMYFSYERNGKEHRVWKVFRNIGLISFEKRDFSNEKELSQTCRINNERFFNLNYESPFRIGMAVYFSMPSTASKQPWCGVSGLVKLFGRKALRKIGLEEQIRIKNIINNFLDDNSIIFAFQKDAYEAISNKFYQLKEALTGNLISNCRFNKNIKLAGFPPTRFFLSKRNQQIVKDVIFNISYKKPT